MTLVTTDKTLLDQLFALIKRKEAHIKEGKDLDKLFKIYSKEMKEVDKLVHKDQFGNIKLVSDMDDDHLFNTINLILKRKYGSFESIPDKYLDEAKKRPGMLDRILGIESTLEIEDEEDEDDLGIYFR